MTGIATKQPPGLRFRHFDESEGPKGLDYYSRLTPGVISAKKVEVQADPALIRLANAKSNELRKERLKGSVLTRIPVYTSFENKGPFEIVVPEPAESSKPKWADDSEAHASPKDGELVARKLDSERENVQRMFARGEGFWMPNVLRGSIYALVQLYIYLAYWFASWVGADFRKPGRWRQMAFRYPPVDGGWDLFNIRAEYESLTRSNVIYTKKKVWFNPETGHYETVMFTNLDDESQYQDRYPGETDGIDPVEFEKYHYLSPEDTVVKWLGEKVFTPIMTIFVAFVTFLVCVNGAKIVISVGNMLAAENPEIASVIVVVLFCRLVLKILRRIGK
ncbi:hypothetical protein TWF718_005746 [Orbilia javanica]|uniref:Uncharacterized protein n=1 Tax=Orbilia javanica TaxID=47235 RepID=A0AAN8N205_9PEZI